MGSRDLASMYFHIKTEAVQRLFHYTLRLVDAFKASSIYLFLFLGAGHAIIDHYFDSVFEHHFH